ncbi:MAG: serine/threonine protein kinase [Archangium sp.]|nr:serine/threonine protein kinase [Archangium sp.]
MIDADQRARAFVAGELSGAELEAFERELDVDSKLRRLVAALSADLTADGGGTVRSARPPVPSPALERGLELGTLLGRGGMAHVHAAVQRHLGREVAVKSLRPGAVGWARDKLIQEARITGFLEHPGIVPVHDLLEAPDGEVQVVLKRVEGKSWAQLMLVPMEIAERFGGDPIDWHVNVAISVSRSLHFAHQRGVLHRDLKPANVMIGRLDEVYLLDWGVAGTFGAHDNAALPAVRDLPFAGTPMHMAPEQLLSQVDRLTPATDTFLLATCLYQAVYGKPPFAGRRLAERIEHPEVPPEFPAGADAPEELVELLQRALQLEPAARFQDADAFRLALEGYARNRDARKLGRRALEHAVAARAAWERGDRVVAEAAAADAEFGFRAALELNPGDVQTRERRDALASDRVRFAAAHDPRAASWLLDTLSAPPTQLVQQVDRALQTERGERARLEEIAKGADRRIGLGTKQIMLGAFGAIWAGAFVFFTIFPPEHATTVGAFLVGYLGLGVAGTVRGRAQLLQHRLNREMMFVHLSWLSTSALLSFLAPSLGLQFPTLWVPLMLLFALGMAAIAVIVEVSSMVPAIVWGLAALIGALFPETLRWAVLLGALLHGFWPLLVSLRFARKTEANSVS